MVSLPDGRFAVRDDHGIQMFDEDGNFIHHVGRGVLGRCYGLTTDGVVRKRRKPFDNRYQHENLAWTWIIKSEFRIGKSSVGRLYWEFIKTGNVPFRATW